MLLESLDPQAGLDEGRDDLAEAVVPAVLALGDARPLSAGSTRR